MRWSLIYTIILASWITVSSADGDITVFVDQGNIKDGGIDLKVDGVPVPTVVDWNNDGKKDLVVGQFIQGHIRLYLNQGSDLNPVFNGFSYIQSNGAPITTTYG